MSEAGPLDAPTQKIFLSSGRIEDEDEQALAKKLDAVNEKLSMSLLQQEEQKRANLHKVEQEHKVLSSKVKHRYNQSGERYKQLTKQEKILSAQAGQLLSALQREEARANKLSATVRKIRHTRKKLLGRISNPRWEVRHHYHMTCFEHVLGHSQPHVLEVGQMVPGHLRLLAFARLATLIHKSLIFSLNRAKNNRDEFSEKIKEVYRSLRLTRVRTFAGALSKWKPTYATSIFPPTVFLRASARFDNQAELKEQDKLIQAMRTKSHLIPDKMEDPRVQVSPVLPVRNLGAKDIRMRYLNSLNMSPETKSLESLDIDVESDRDLAGEWKTVMNLLSDLEAQSLSRNKATEELMFVESCRERFKVGLDGLPGPIAFDDVSTEEEDEILERQVELVSEAVDDLQDIDLSKINLGSQQQQTKQSLSEEASLLGPKVLSGAKKDAQHFQESGGSGKDTSDWHFGRRKAKGLVGPSSRSQAENDVHNNGLQAESAGSAKILGLSGTSDQGLVVVGEREDAEG